MLTVETEVYNTKYKAAGGSEESHQTTGLRHCPRVPGGVIKVRRNARYRRYDSPEVKWRY